MAHPQCPAPGLVPRPAPSLCSPSPYAVSAYPSHFNATDFCCHQWWRVANLMARGNRDYSNGEREISPWDRAREGWGGCWRLEMRLAACNRNLGQKRYPCHCMLLIFPFSLSPLVCSATNQIQPVYRSELADLCFSGFIQTYQCCLKKVNFTSFFVIIIIGGIPLIWRWQSFSK